jgi:hypothetical protein
LFASKLFRFALRLRVLERSSGLVIAQSSRVVGAQPPSHRLRRGSRAPGPAVRPLAVGSPYSALEVAPRLLSSRAARPLASRSLACFASFRAGARRSGEVQLRRHRSAVPSLPSCKPFKHTGRIEQVCRTGRSQHRASSVLTSKARRMREPNPSIERTSSSQLRWPAAAAHVER